MRRNKPLCEDKSNIGYLSCRNCYCRQYLPTLKKLYEQLNGILNTHTHTYLYIGGGNFAPTPDRHPRS